MNSLLNSKLFFVVLILLIFWLGNSLVNSSRQREVIDREIESYEAKINEAQNNNENLVIFLKNLAKSSFLDREARLKYNYKGADEQVAFVYPDNNSRPISQSFEELLKTMPNWKKWWYWLFGR